MQNGIDPIFVVDDDQGILESFDAILGDDYQLVMIDNGRKQIADVWQVTDAEETGFPFHALLENMHEPQVYCV